MPQRSTASGVLIAVLWDALVAGLLAAGSWLWPDVLPWWMGLCGVPLLACRAGIAAAEVAQIAYERGVAGRSA